MFPSLKPDRMNEHPVCMEDKQHKKLHRLFIGHNLIGFIVICIPQKSLTKKKNNDVTRTDVYCHQGGETVQFGRKKTTTTQIILIRLSLGVLWSCRENGPNATTKNYDSLET